MQSLKPEAGFDLSLAPPDKFIESCGLNSNLGPGTRHGNFPMVGLQHKCMKTGR